jgi:hypothetical protein
VGPLGPLELSALTTACTAPAASAAAWFPGWPAASFQSAKQPCLGLHPIVTSQHSSTTFYQVPYHTQSLFS